MATPYTDAYVRYDGNGVTTEFSIDFDYKAESEIKVYIKRGDEEQITVPSSNYSFVTKNTLKFPATGSSETVLDVGDILAIQRESEFASEYVFDNQRRLEPVEVMNSDDNLERQIQELKRDVRQAVRVQPTSKIDTNESFKAVESIYENIGGIKIVSGISSEVVVCSENIEAIKDAPNQASAAAQSALGASQSADESRTSATEAKNSSDNAQESANTAAASASYAAGVEANIHNIVDDAAQTLSERLNNPFFFGQSMWSDVAPNNASWLISAGQWNARSVYPDYYDWLVEQRNTGIKTFYLWHLTTDPNVIVFLTFTNTLSVGITVYAYTPAVVYGEITAISGNEVTIRNDLINQTSTLSIDVANHTTASLYLYDRSKINIISKAELDGWDLPFNTSDYDFVINTTDQTFRLPLKNGKEGIFADGVKGNGMALGVTNGTELAGLFRGRVDINAKSDLYGKAIGTEDRGKEITSYKAIGITTDPSKSGMVVDKTVPSGWNLYYYVGETVQDASLINAGAVLNDVANLKAHSIVETYHNGTEWYRIWSDGWIEQGGYSFPATPTVTFLKPFSDNNYNLLTQPCNKTATSGGASYMATFNHTVSGFSSFSNVNITGYEWQACGY